MDLLTGIVRSWWVRTGGKHAGAEAVLGAAGLWSVAAGSFVMRFGGWLGLAFFNEHFSSLTINSRFGWGLGVTISGDEGISMTSDSPAYSIELHVIDRENTAGVASLQLQSCVVRVHINTLPLNISLAANAAPTACLATKANMVRWPGSPSAE